MVSARPAVQALPAYKPGRNPADLAREIGVDRAIKLASNEVAFPPLPAVVQALATAAGGDQPLPGQRRRRPHPGAGRPLRRGSRAGRHRLRRGHDLPGARPGVQRPGHEHRLRLALLRDVPAAGPGRRRARRPGAAHARAGPAARPTPTTSRRWPPRSTTPPGWSSSATRTTPPGRRCAGRSSRQFLDAVPEQTLVVLDEAYREFVTDPDVPDGLELMRGRPNVAVLRTFSKAWGLAGIRVGYLIAEDPAVAEAVAQDARAVQRLDAGAGRRRRRAGQRGRGARPVRRRRRRARPADRRPARARPGRRRQPGQLRLAAGGGADGGRSRPPSRRARSSPGRSPARASGSPSAPPRRTTSSSPPSTTCGPRHRRPDLRCPHVSPGRRTERGRPERDAAGGWFDGRRASSPCALRHPADGGFLPPRQLPGCAAPVGARCRTTHEAFYCVVDLHAITLPTGPGRCCASAPWSPPRSCSRSGVDPDRSTLFVQSHVPEHLQLSWVLECLTGFGEASRMTQFKDKSQREGTAGATRRPVHLPGAAGRRHPALPGRPGAGRRGPAPAPRADPRPRDRGSTAASAQTFTRARARTSRRARRRSSTCSRRTRR